MLSATLKKYIAEIMQKQMGGYFDAHDVINVLYNDPRYRPVYDVDEKTCKTTETYHSQISKCITSMPEVFQNGTVRSLNIHGVDSPNMSYRKRGAPVDEQQVSSEQQNGKFTTLWLIAIVALAFAIWMWIKRR